MLAITIVNEPHPMFEEAKKTSRRLSGKYFRTWLSCIAGVEPNQDYNKHIFIVPTSGMKEFKEEFLDNLLDIEGLINPEKFNRELVSAHDIHYVIFDGRMLRKKH